MPFPHRPRCSRLATSRRLLLLTLLVTPVCFLGYLHLYRLALTRTKLSPVASSDSDRQQPSLSAASIARFVLDITQRKRWKLYKNNAHKISQVSWRYPYLDISFYRQNASHVWDRDVKNFYMFIYPKHWIFPLTSRPFQGRWLPAPRDVKNTLNLTYNLNMCQTGGYSHQKEMLNKKLYYLPCKELHGVVPFVERVEFVGGCRETLVLGDKALGHHFLQDTNC